MPHDALPLPEHEVYAIRYAHMERRRRDIFIDGDPHDAAMPMDFFLWLVRSSSRLFLIDTGFNARTAALRKRDLNICPIAALSRLGVTADEIKDVVLTHLHFDHAGNLDKLPNAVFYVQDSEVEYSTGRCMCHEALR